MAPQDTGTGTGFDQYAQTTSTGSSTPTGNGTQLLTSQFPSQYQGAQYPGIRDKYLNYTVPGSGTSISDVVGTMPAGVARDYQGNFDGTSPTSTIQQMLDNLLALSQTDPHAAAQLQDSLILGGYLNPYQGGAGGYTPGGVVIPGDATWDAYAHLLLDSVRQGTSYQDLLNTKIGQGAGEAKFSITQTSTRIDQTNPQTARLALAQVLEQELGRQPTNAEIASFAGSLAASEQNNPVTETTHLNLADALNSNGAGRHKNQTTVSSGGVDPTVEAQNFALSNNGQEMAQFAGEKVYDVFRRMLAGGQ